MEHILGGEAEYREHFLPAAMAMAIWIIYGKIEQIIK